ncbi:hypothetical protein AAGG74_17120 [Bacillus mexicanus]|uniref:hypothetical protein n=1 Tax=Bacillus mexicanus TaxID=2834415 RepID=UPI003D207D68
MDDKKKEIEEIIRIVYHNEKLYAFLKKSIKIIAHILTLFFIMCLLLAFHCIGLFSKWSEETVMITHITAITLGMAVLINGFSYYLKGDDYIDTLLEDIKAMKKILEKNKS